jgi:hypothetical protein
VTVTPATPQPTADFPSAAPWGIPLQVTVADLLDALWRDYVALMPQAERIHALLTRRGEILCNDHIALRTLAVPGIGCDAVARPFEALGWRRREDHRLSGLLRARCWQHDDPELPRLVVTELALDELSREARAMIAALLEQLPARFGARSDLAWSGRPWQVSSAAYQALRAESEHAAWVAAFGFRVHHVAVDLASLSTFPDLDALGAFLIEHGFRLCDRGVQGARTRGLEQLATRDEILAVRFSDATVDVPSCGYGFARRSLLPTGELFQGFLPDCIR